MKQSRYTLVTVLLAGALALGAASLRATTTTYTVSTSIAVPTENTSGNIILNQTG